MRALGILIGLSKMMEGNYAELSLMIDNFPRREAEKHSYLNTKASVHNQV